MLLQQVRGFIEPYLIEDSTDPLSKIETTSFGVFRGTRLKGSPALEYMISLLGGCECAEFRVEELIVQVHPLSLLSLRAKMSSNSEDAGLSIELRGVRFAFREKGQAWRTSKGDVETLDYRLSIFQAIRQMVYDSTMMEQFQHDTMVFSTAKWVVSRVAHNVRIQLTNVVVDLFPEKGQTPVTMKVDDISIIDSGEDPCSGYGFGHVQGGSVLRKLLTINNTRIDIGGKKIFGVDTVEISLALNLSTEAIGLCTALEIKIGDTQSDIDRDSYLRLTRIPRLMNEGVKWEEKANADLDAKLKQMEPVSTSDLSKMNAAYIRILESADPNADADVIPPTTGPSELGHPVTWLQLKEMQLGEAQVTQLLKEASEAIRSKRAQETVESMSRTSRVGGWFGWGGRNKTSKIDDRISVLESLNLLRQDASRVRLVFDSLDLDKSGTVDVVELQRGLANCGLNLGADRILGLMKEMDESSDGTISFDEFKNFLSRMDRSTQFSESSVVSVALVVHIQKANIRINPALDMTVLGMTLAANSSGMPYYRRHDYTVGTKKVAMYMDGLDIRSSRSSASIMNWGNKIKSASEGKVETKTSLRFVEFKPYDEATASDSNNKELDEGKELEESKELDSSSNYRVVVEYPIARGVTKRRLYKTSLSTWDKKTQRAVFMESAPLTESTLGSTEREEVYRIKLLVGDGESNRESRSFLGRWLNLSSNQVSEEDEEEAIYAGHKLLAGYELKIPRPSSTTVESSKTGRVVKSQDRWVVLENEAGQKIGDLLVRIKTEAWLEAREPVVATVNNLKMHQTAFRLDLIHSPGIQVSDLAIKLDMSPFRIDYTKDAATALTELGNLMSVEEDTKAHATQAASTVQANAASAIQATTKGTVETATQARPPPAPSSFPVTPDRPNPQQVPMPGDLFGFTTFASLDDKSSTVPSLLRSSILLNLFGTDDGSVITIDSDPESTKYMEMRFKPCSIYIETNKGCSSEIGRDLGFEGHDGEEGYIPDVEQRRVRDGSRRLLEDDGKSQGEESYVTAYENEWENDEEDDETGGGLAMALNREFHAFVTFQGKDENFEIVFSEMTKQQHEHGGSHRLHHGHFVSIGVFRPRMFFNLKLDPSPRADFNTTVQEVFIRDLSAKQKLFGRYFSDSDDAYTTGQQFLLGGEYARKGTSFQMGVDGVCVMVTPIVLFLTDLTKHIPTSAVSARSASTSDANQQKTQQQQQQQFVEPPPPLDFNTVVVLPTDGILGKLFVTRVEVYVLEHQSLREASKEGKLRTLCLRTKAKGSVDIRSEAAGGSVPLYEKVEVGITTEIVRMDLRRPRQVNRLVDPFLTLCRFATAREAPGDAKAMTTFSEVVRRAVEQRNEDGEVIAPPPLMDKTPTIIQDTSVSIEGGFNGRMDSSDFRFMMSAMNTLSEAMGPTTAVDVEEAPPPPSPAVQSMTSGSADSSEASVWTIMSSLYPYVVLMSSSSSAGEVERRKQQRVVELRRKLAEQAEKAYKRPEGTDAAAYALQRFELNFIHMLMGVGVLGESGFPTPFLRAHLAELKFGMESSSGTWFAKGVTGTGLVSVECQSFNTISYAWEPLVEPWTVRMRMQRTMDEETMISIFAGARLNFNVTESVVFNLAKFSSFIDPNVRTPPEDARLKGPYCPNWVVNETGENMKVWIIRSGSPGEERGENGDLIELEPDRVKQLHLRDRKALFESGDRLVDKYIATLTRQARRQKTTLQKFPDRTELLRDIFRKIDRDGNGELSVSELQRALAGQDEIIPRDQLEYEIAIATNKPNANVGVNAEEFAAFFSRAKGASKERTVSSLGLRIPNLSKSDKDFFLAPPHLNGVYVLPCSDPQVNQSPNQNAAQLFGVVEKMGRLVVSSVLRVETRIKIENRLVGFTMQVGYYADENNGRETSKSEMPSSTSSPGSRLVQKGRNMFSALLGRPAEEASGGATGATAAAVQSPSSSPSKVVPSTITKRFVSVLDIAPGKSKCIPLRFFRNKQVTEFYFRVVTPPSENSFSSVSTTTTTAAAVAAQANVVRSDEERSSPAAQVNVTGEYFESKSALITVGADHQDIPIHSMRTVKRNRVQNEEQLYSVLQIESREQDMLESELVDVNLVRADRVVLRGGREFICSERIVPSHRYLCRPVLNVQVMSGRGLIPRDVTGYSDPYVIVKAGNETYRTPTVNRSLDPKWPGRSSTFTVGQHSDSGLPEEITFEIFDEDRLRRDDSMGHVKIKTSELIAEVESEGGEGRSLIRTYKVEGNGRGQLTIGWKYESRANLSLPSKIHQRVVAFSPSLTLENLLPVAMHFELKTDLVTETYVLAQGKSCVPNPLYDGAMVCTDKCQVRLRVVESDPWVVLDSLDRPIVIDSSQGTFIINADLLHEKDGTRRLIIFADFWVANKSGPDVEFNLDLPPIGTGPEGELRLNESLLPRIRTRNLKDNGTMCISLPRNRSNDRKDVIVRARMRVDNPGDDGEADSYFEYVSVDEKKAFSKILAVPKPVNLDDAKVQANEGIVLLKLEGSRPRPLLSAASSLSARLHSGTSPRRRHVSGDLLVVIRRLKDVEEQVGEEMIPKQIVALGIDEVVPMKKMDDEHFVLKQLGRVTRMSDDWNQLFLEITSSEPAPDPKKWKISFSELHAFFQKERNHNERWGFLDPIQSSVISPVRTAQSMLEIGLFVHNSLANSSDEVRTANARSRFEDERISVGTTSLYGKWFRTRLVTFAPMFTVAKEAGCDLQIFAKVAGADDRESILLGTDPKPLRFVESLNPCVQFRLASMPRACWTAPIPLMHDHDFPVQLRDEQGRRYARFLFDINRSGPSRCIVVRDCPAELTRVIVRNRSSQQTIRLRQVVRIPRRSITQILTCRGKSSATRVVRTGDLVRGESDSFPVDELEPNGVLPIAFDIFDDVTSPMDDEYVHVPRLVIEPRPGISLVCKLKEGYRASSGDFAVKCETRGAHLVVDVMHQTQGGGPLSRLSGRNLAASEDEEENKLVDVTSVAMRLAGVGISLYSSTRKNEVMYLLMQRIHLEASQFTRCETDVTAGLGASRMWTTTKSEVAIGKMQIDSSLPSANYPVTLTSDLALEQSKRKKLLANLIARKEKSLKDNLDARQHKGQEDDEPIPPPIVTEGMEQWAPKLCGPEARKKRKEESFFRLTTHAANPVNNPEAVVYKNVEATVRSLDVRIDEIFLGGLLSVLLAQADASAFSNSTIVQAEENTAETIAKTLPEDVELIKTCFEQDLSLPPRDSSFIEAAYVSGWTVSLTVKLGSPDELIPLAKRYGIPVNLLMVAIRLSRLEALLFDLPNYPERAVGSEKIVTKYSALLMSAFWQQLGEVLFNFGKRILMDMGILKSLGQTEKVRSPPESSEVLTLYGPGFFPQPTEVLIETAAVRRIEMWYARRKQIREAGGQHPLEEKQPSSRLANLVYPLTGPASQNKQIKNAKGTSKKQQNEQKGCLRGCL